MQVEQDRKLKEEKISILRTMYSKALDEYEVSTSMANPYFGV